MWSIMTDCNRFLFKFLLFFVFTGCYKPMAHHTLNGYALGTSYNVQIVGATAVAQLQRDIDSLFNLMNQSMSTYLPDSDISKINRGDTTVVVDEHFQKVFRKATEVWSLSDGYFDPTVGALVNAYGFGPEKPLTPLDITKKTDLLQLTGWQKVQLLSTGSVRKKSPLIYLDFNALAKGYAVDLLGEYLATLGVKDYMVEVGGEIVAKGNSPKTGSPWKIAIDDPQQQQERKFINVRILRNQAMATSGNYRKYRVDSETGARYVHSVNPKTGDAFRTSVLSASVVAPDCMTADAWATALMILPLQKGQELIAQHKELEAYWVVADEAGGVKEYFSNGW